MLTFEKTEARSSLACLKKIFSIYFGIQRKKYKPLNSIVGFPNSGSEFDAAIQYWLEYWRSEGVSVPDDLDPLMVKAMIAVESGFGPKKKAKGSTAEGLMQLTDQSMRVLGGHPNKKKWIEAKDHLIHIEKAVKLDPLVNIAMGTRLLGHKYSQIPKSWDKSAKNAIRSYYSRGKGGEEYADKVMGLYEKSKKK